MIPQRIEPAPSAPPLAPAPHSRRRPSFRFPLDGPLWKPSAVERFGEICAIIPQATFLRDVSLDEVLFSFGAKTLEVRDRLAEYGHAIELLNWGPQSVLRVTFAEDPTDVASADRLGDAIIAILGEMELAETRLW